MALIHGVGTLQISATAGAFSIGKLQNVSINISYESAQLRGSEDVFACDTQFFDGSVEGSFEHGDIELSQIAKLLGGSGAFAGAGGSGTMTLTGQSKPGLGSAFKIRISGVTNGVTSTVIIQRAFIPSFTLDLSRTDYAIPSMNFIAEYSTASGLMSIQQ